MSAKSLDAKDITVSNGSGVVVSPFDCGYGYADDNDSNDSGGSDWPGLFVDDSDRSTC
jgi:hypothetical protein